MLFRSTFRRQSRRAGPSTVQSLPPETTHSLINPSILCLLFRLGCFFAQTALDLHTLALREGCVSLRDPSSDPHHISPSVTISAHHTPTFQVPPLDSQWRLVSLCLTNARSLVHRICVASKLRAEGNCIWWWIFPEPLYPRQEHNTTTPSTAHQAVFRLFSPYPRKTQDNSPSHLHVPAAWCPRDPVSAICGPWHHHLPLNPFLPLFLFLLLLIRCPCWRPPLLQIVLLLPLLVELLSLL